MHYLKLLAKQSYDNRLDTCRRVHYLDIFAVSNYHVDNGSTQYEFKTSQQWRIAGPKRRLS